MRDSRTADRTDLRRDWPLKFAAGLLQAVVVLSVVLSSALAVGADAPVHPNIVVILADDLGYGDLGCYGQRRIATPHIDHLAVEGVRFTQFYAGTAVCAPSRCVLITGLHTGHCYIRGNSEHSLRASDFTVAQALKGAGYATGIFGKWGLAQEKTAGVPTRKGFDEFFGYLDNIHAHNYYPAFLISNESRVLLKNVVPGPGEYGSGVATKRVEYSPDVICDRALSFIDRNKDRPFFLYFASTLPHANNQGSPNGCEVPDFGIYRDKDWPDVEKGFAAMVTHLDADVGRLLERLKKDGLDDRTLVFFTSDNGPHREGGHDYTFFDSNGPLRGFKRALYEGGIRAPMIVRWPGHAPKGIVSEHVGYSGDFFATAAEIAGASLPPGLDSVSFLPSIVGDNSAQKKHRYLYWEFYERGPAQAIRIDNWKGVIPAFGSKQVELYDLQTDPGETTDVAAQHAPVVQQILAMAREAHVRSPLWSERDAADRQRARAKRNR